MLQTATPRGLHEFVVASVLARYARPGARAVDLGADPGAMTERLHALGCDVIPVDCDPAAYKGDLPLVTLDFNQPAFASQLGIARFDLVVTVEVFEHVESPIGFLRNIGQLLAPGGVAVITTPNVDSLPARAKFLLAGKIRMMDDNSEPKHISPIFFDLFRRQFLPRAGLRLREHFVFPPNGYQHTRKPIAWAMRIATLAFSGVTLLGDNHIFVVEAAS